jgi:GxxExxY protein
MNEPVEQVGRAVLDGAFRVHTALGCGLLESVYEAALALELQKRGYKVERQKAIPVFYEGELLEVGFRADLIVNNSVLVEVKSVQEVTDLFKKVTRNYLKLIPLHLGFLINFNEVHLRHGITRIVNDLEGKEFFIREEPAEYFVSPSSPSLDVQFPESTTSK